LEKINILASAVAFRSQKHIYLHPELMNLIVFNDVSMTSITLMFSFCLHFWCYLQQYQTLEHWYQPGEHQTACQPETE